MTVMVKHLIGGGSPPCRITFWDGVRHWFHDDFLKGLMDVWNDIRDFFSQGGGGDPGGFWAGDFLGWSPWAGSGGGFWEGFPNYGGGGGSVGSNPTTTFSLSDYFNSNLFMGQLGSAFIELENIIKQYNLFICINELHDILFYCLYNQYEFQGDCFAPGVIIGNAPECYEDALKLLQMNPSDPCIINVIQTYTTSEVQMNWGDGRLVCAIQEVNNFDIPDIDIYILLIEKCAADLECQGEILSVIYDLGKYFSGNEITLTHLEWILDEDSPENFLIALELLDFLEENSSEILLSWAEEAFDFLINHNLTISDGGLKISLVGAMYDDPEWDDFEHIEDVKNSSYKNRVLVIIQILRGHGFDWFPDLLEDIVTCNEFETAGDLFDVYRMAVDYVYEINKTARNAELVQWMEAIFSPDNVGAVYGIAMFSNHMSKPFRSQFFSRFSFYSKNLAWDLSKGYNSFNAFKNAHGSAGQGKHWHHIVENQAINTSGFPAKSIHHPNNLVKISGGYSGSWHSEITKAFSQPGRYNHTNGKSLREWLKGKPFEVHYEWGLKVMREVRPGL